MRFCDASTRGYRSAFRSVHADTSGDTGKQKMDSKTHYFSLKYVPTINLHDVMRCCMYMKIRLMSGIAHVLDM